MSSYLVRIGEVFWVIALFEYKGNSLIRLKSSKKMADRNRRTCRWVIGEQSYRNNLKKTFRMKNSVVYNAFISEPVDLSTGRF